MPFEAIDPEETLVLCRDAMRCVASLLASLGPYPFDRRQQESLLAMREILEGVRCELDGLLRQVPPPTSRRTRTHPR
jgi:hypothetical protein